MHWQNQKKSFTFIKNINLFFLSLKNLMTTSKKLDLSHCLSSAVWSMVPLTLISVFFNNFFSNRNRFFRKFERVNVQICLENIFIEFIYMTQNWLDHNYVKCSFSSSIFLYFTLFWVIGNWYFWPISHYCST